MNIFENISAVIFDFDGTLYDNHGLAANFIKQNLFGSIKMLAERKTHKILKGVYLNSYENFYVEYIKQLTICRHKKPVEKNLTKISDWYKNDFLNALVLMLKKKYVARENVNLVFENLKKRNIKIAILSDYEVVLPRMKALNISSENVDLIYGAAELGGLKPAPEIFLKIANELKIKPENILVVGDRDDTDGEGARNSGMKFVQIKTIKNSKNPELVAKNNVFLGWQEFLSFC